MNDYHLHAQHYLTVCYSNGTLFTRQFRSHENEMKSKFVERVKASLWLEFKDVEKPLLIIPTDTSLIIISASF